MVPYDTIIHVISIFLKKRIFFPFFSVKLIFSLSSFKVTSCFLTGSSLHLNWYRYKGISSKHKKNSTALFVDTVIILKLLLSVCTAPTHVLS